MLHAGLIGTAIGLALPVPVAALALAWAPFETLKHVLVPVLPILHDTVDFATWPAPAALAVVTLTNGALYGASALVLAAGERLLRRGPRRRL